MARRYPDSYTSDSLARQRELREELRPRFGVLAGGGLDEARRQGVSQDFLQKIRLATAAAVFLFSICLARVYLTAATVDMLQETSNLRTELSEAESLNEELLVELSVVSSTNRIVSLATESYGMVLPDSYVVLNLTDAANEAAAAEEAAAAADPDSSEAADAALTETESEEEATLETMEASVGFSAEGLQEDSIVVPEDV